MDGNSADEVFRSIDLTEVSNPPSIGSFAIDGERSLRGERYASDYEPRSVCIWFLIFPVITSGCIEHRDGLALSDDEKELTLLVDFGKCAFLSECGRRSERLIEQVGGSRGNASGWLQPEVLLECHHCLSSGVFETTISCR